MNRICTICDSVFLCLFLQQDVQTRPIEKTKETNCYFRILFEEHFKKGSLTKGALGTNKKLVDINRPEDLINVTSTLSGFHDLVASEVRESLEWLPKPRHGDFQAVYRDVQLGMGPKIVKMNPFLLSNWTSWNCKSSACNMNHLVIGMRQLVIILSLPCECTHLVHGE